MRIPGYAVMDRRRGGDELEYFFVQESHARTALDIAQSLESHRAHERLEVVPATVVIEEDDDALLRVPGLAEALDLLERTAWAAGVAANQYTEYHSRETFEGRQNALTMLRRARLSLHALMGGPPVVPEADAVASPADVTPVPEDEEV